MNSVSYLRPGDLVVFMRGCTCSLYNAAGKMVHSLWDTEPNLPLVVVSDEHSFNSYFCFGDGESRPSPSYVDGFCTVLFRTQVLMARKNILERVA